MSPGSWLALSAGNSRYRGLPGRVAETPPPPVLMPGAQWLELLLRHVPDRYEHLVRYVGWYSNRARQVRLGAADSQGL